jgi:hypothetical protein
VKGDWGWPRGRSGKGRGFLAAIKAGMPVGDSYIRVMEYRSARGVTRRHILSPAALSDGGAQTLCLRATNFVSRDKLQYRRPTWTTALVFRPNIDCTLCSRKLVAWVHFETRGRKPYMARKGRTPWYGEKRGTS